MQRRRYSKRNLYTTRSARTLFGALFKWRLSRDAPEYNGCTCSPMPKDHVSLDDHRSKCPVRRANVIESKTQDGVHLPIIDLDGPHKYVASTTPDHGHLYINTPVSPWRWRLLMFALYQAGVIERGYFWWSIRRDRNIVRLNGVKKMPGEGYYGVDSRRK